MKKSFLILGILLAAIEMQAAFYFVQTGKDGDPTWTAESKWANGTGGTLVDLTAESKTFGEWLGTITGAQDVWVAGGTYLFNESATLPIGVKIYGSFAGTEKSTPHRELTAQGAAAWDWKVKTVFDAQSKCQFFSNNTNSTIDGITFQNANYTGNAGCFRTGNNSKVQNCQFLNNTASGNGGALLVYNASSQITNCYFSGNKGNNGGAINMSGGTGTYTLVVDGCEFAENDAVNNGSSIYMSIGANTITNSVFHGNKTRTAVQATSGICTISHNTFVNNTKGSLNISAGTITNNVFWGEGATIMTYVGATMDHNAVQGSRYKGDNCIELSANNTGTEDGILYPCFTDPANHDYSLQPKSVLIGIGATGTGVTKDIIGTDRNTTPDMGAYEHAYEMPAPSYTLTIGAAGMSTLMLPFTVTEFPTGVKVYSLQIQESEIVATSQAQISADKPVLVVAEEGEYEFVGEGSANIAFNRDRHSFCDLEASYYGYAAPAKTDKKYNYVLQKQGDSEPAFYQIESGKTIYVKPYRAFLKTMMNVNEGGAKAALRIRFADNTATAIADDAEAMVSVKKCMINGELHIIKGAHVYNAQGMMVE